MKDFIRSRLPGVFNFAKISKGAIVKKQRALIRNHSPELYYKKKTLDEIKATKKSMHCQKIGRIPKNIVVEINNTCNLDCPMCGTQKAKRKKGEMSLELFEKIIKRIEKLGYRTIAIHTVGEPFFYSKLPEVFGICKKHKLKLTLTTNGLLLDKHMNLIKRFTGTVSRIKFSVDGATKETYEKLRKGGDFGRLIRNLELISDYNRSVKKAERIFTFLHATIGRGNFSEIPLFFKVFKNFFSNEDIRFGFITNLTSCHEEGVYYKASTIYADKVTRLRVPCKLLWCQTHILCNGDVSACCRDYNGELIVGNILDKPIADIWKNSRYEHYRDIHRRYAVETLPFCKDCRGMAPEARIILNNYIHYLFYKFKDYPNEFYLGGIRGMLNYLSIHYKDNFITSYNDLSFFQVTKECKII